MAIIDSTSTLSPSLLDRLIDDDPRINSPLFTLFDLVNPGGLALKLREAQDSVSAHIREQMNSEIQRSLENLNSGAPVPGLLQEGIVEGLNKLVDGECLYEPERFREVSLAEATIRLIQEKPDGRGLMFLNRYLLEDVYPRYLRTRRVQETSYTIREFKQSVSRDIESLLNSRRELLEELPAAFKELDGSLLYYGLPDFTAMSLMSHKDRKKIRRVIQHTIVTFEPRLKSVEVTVLDPTGLDQSLHFRIDALLQVEPDPEAVTFDAVLQLSTATYDVQSN
ncbi:type VI secretion system baseplate subunit TssE [Candidatus Nitrospira salsa]